MPEHSFHGAVQLRKLSAAQTELDGLKKSSGDIAAVQRQLADLQSKYDADTSGLKGQLADRDYADAISKAISGKGLKFSSKAAERDFTARLREKKLELKDGELQGVDDFIQSQREAEPDAFAPDRPAPRFVTPAGVGGKPQSGPSRAAQLAARYNENLYGKAKESD